MVLFYFLVNITHRCPKTKNDGKQPSLGSWLIMPTILPGHHLSKRCEHSSFTSPRVHKDRHSFYLSLQQLILIDVIKDGKEREIKKNHHPSWRYLSRAGSAQVENLCCECEWWWRVTVLPEHARLIRLEPQTSFDACFWWFQGASLLKKWLACIEERGAASGLEHGVVE